MQLDHALMIANKTVLITGGTGSFGRALVRHLIPTSIAEIRIFSRDENEQARMRRLVPDSRLRFFIGDVRDYDSVYEATKGAHLVFHAAALKQVPACEFYPLEAIRTNIIGVQNVIECSLAHKVQRLIA